LGNIILSAAGIYIFTEFMHIHYIISKLLSSIVLGLSYNYFMQKYFVFA
jgi:putative flippase GtrA